MLKCTLCLRSLKKTNLKTAKKVLERGGHSGDTNVETLEVDTAMLLEKVLLQLVALHLKGNEMQ